MGLQRGWESAIFRLLGTAEWVGAHSRFSDLGPGVAHWNYYSSEFNTSNVSANATAEDIDAELWTERDSWREP